MNIQIFDSIAPKISFDIALIYFNNKKKRLNILLMYVNDEADLCRVWPVFQGHQVRERKGVIRT